MGPSNANARDFPALSRVNPDWSSGTLSPGDNHNGTLRWCSSKKFISAMKRECQLPLGSAHRSSSPCDPLERTQGYRQPERSRVPNVSVHITKCRDAYRWRARLVPACDRGAVIVDRKATAITRLAWESVVDGELAFRSSGSGFRGGFSRWRLRLVASGASAGDVVLANDLLVLAVAEFDATR